jgi:hypothetical protein
MGEILDMEIKKQEAPGTEEIHISDSKRGGPICVIWFMSVLSFILVGGMIAAIQANPQLLWLFILIIICWGAFMAWIVHYLWGTLSKRTFTLTDEYIEFHVPPVPVFKIAWSDFDEISITERKEYHEMLRYSDTYLAIAFKGKSIDKVFGLDVGRGFHRKNLDSILATIKENAVKKGKRYNFLL